VIDRLRSWLGVSIGIVWHGQYSVRDQIAAPKRLVESTSSTRKQVVFVMKNGVVIKP